MFASGVIERSTEPRVIRKTISAREDGGGRPLSGRWADLGEEVVELSEIAERLGQPAQPGHSAFSPAASADSQTRTLSCSIAFPVST